MTRAQAKEHEIDDVATLVRLWQEWRDSPPTIVSGERPDAILLFDSGPVGLEHTSVVSEQLARGQAAIKRCKKSVADALLREGLQARVHLSFSATTAAVMPTRALGRNVKAILELTREAIQHGALLKLRSAQLEERGIDYTDRITIEPRPGELGAASWGWTARGQGTWLTTMAIADKTAKLPEYRLNHPEASAFWLLLVSDRGPDAPNWDDAQDASVVPGFDRIFFLLRRGGRERVYELALPVVV